MRSSDPLYGILYIPLPLLLLWTGTTSIKLDRQHTKSRLATA